MIRNTRNKLKTALFSAFLGVAIVATILTCVLVPTLMFNSLYSYEFASMVSCQIESKSSRSSSTELRYKICSTFPKTINRLTISTKVFDWREEGNYFVFLGSFSVDFYGPLEQDESMDFVVDIYSGSADQEVVDYLANHSLSDIEFDFELDEIAYNTGTLFWGEYTDYPNVELPEYLW